MGDISNGVDVGIPCFEECTRPNASKEDIRDTYNRWSSTYEKEIQALGQRRPHIIAAAKELFGDNKNAKILDAGAGPGNVGQMLFDVGYKNLDALDASSQMLEEAKRKNVYHRFICDFLGPNKLDVETDTYDVIMCIGSLLSTHVTEDAFDEMIRITKPGGCIVFITGAKVMGEWRTHVEECMKRTHDEGKWDWCINRVINHFFSRVDGYDGIFYACKIPLK